MRVTGLHKGGIYNHFTSKEELALEAFGYTIDQVRKRYAEAIRGKTSAIDQLIAIASINQNIVDDPPLKGGCPLLNTATESDHAHSALREKTKQAMNQFLQFIRIVIKKGIRTGEIRPNGLVSNLKRGCSHTKRRTQVERLVYSIHDRNGQQSLDYRCARLGDRGNPVCFAI